jgi:hypothetical protein
MTPFDHAILPSASRRDIDGRGRCRRTRSCLPCRSVCSSLATSTTCFPTLDLATVEVLERHGSRSISRPARRAAASPWPTPAASRILAPWPSGSWPSFRDYEYVVCPSGSCVSMVRHHYDAYFAGRPGFEDSKRKTMELCEFLVDVLGIERIAGSFPHRVGLHNSCHGHRELRLGASSELVIRPLQQSPQAARFDRRHSIDRTEPSRRMLWFRRHVCGERRSGLDP